MAKRNGTGTRTTAKKFRIRITGFETKPARAFKFNPLNWRRHGDVQRAALRSMLGDVGWVQGVIENKRTGNLIDGHARIEEAVRDDPDQAVPYLVVDLSPAEEKAVLATLDPIGALAETDPDQVDQLYAETIKAMPGLEELLTTLHYDVDADNGEGEEETKTVEFRRTFKIVIECTSARQQKKIMRQLDQAEIEYSAK
jgi:hypothetical protein